jgi:hypothetical protein
MNRALAAIPARDLDRVAGLIARSTGAAWRGDYALSLKQIDLATAIMNSYLAYHDPRWPPRACDYCHQPYTGPAVYCSLPCAIDDA